jgi:hypothetical protein
MLKRGGGFPALPAGRSRLNANRLGVMAGKAHTLELLRPSQPRLRVQRWQVARTWARLIREAEGLWHVEPRAMHRLAAQELGLLLQEVPPSLRRRVNRWLCRFGVLTRLNP